LWGIRSGILMFGSNLGCERPRIDSGADP